MGNERPPDWDWVAATQKCKPQAMFGRLQVLAQRDIETRNKDLGREAFRLIEINGIEFSVSKEGGTADRVFFKVTDDLNRIAIGADRTKEWVYYTVGLDGDGLCKLRQGANELDLWQVLKAALEPLLFG